MIDVASHYLFCYTLKPDQKFKQKLLEQKSCEDFNVGRAMLPAWAGNIAYLLTSRDAI